MDQLPGMMHDFEQFRATLDERNDRRERIIKISRDITAESKKLIFALHRVKPPSSPPLENSDNFVSVPRPEDVDKRSSLIKTLLVKLAAELTSPKDVWRFQKSYSPGIQEFIEAVTFEGYIFTGKIPTIEQVQSQNMDTPITMSDYLLGVLDLTGELMRRAVTYPTTRLAILNTLRHISVQFEMFYGPGSVGKSSASSDFTTKRKVLRSSCRKVEEIWYQQNVRGNELINGDEITAVMT